MTVSRRDFLVGGAALGLWPGASLAETTSDGFQLVRARPAAAALLGADQPSTGIWSFSDGANPLVLRARQGEEFKLRISNELNPEIWLHWFGVRGPSNMMTLNVAPGADNPVDCVFTPPDAGTFWLGPMADVSRVRDMGLYAMLVVEEREPVAGIADISLILDDWKLSDDGAIEGEFGDAESMVGGGRLGNWFTVNGQYRPQIKLAPGSATRLRLLNAANVRTMRILFKGADQLLIALDGQPLQPRTLDQGALTLAVGQRADLLVLPEADVVIALDLFEDISEIAYLVGERNGIAAALPENFRLPANPISSKLDLGTARAVPLTIEGGIKGGLKSAIYQGEELDLRALLEKGMGWAFNGVAGPGGPSLVDARLGETIVFEIGNRTAFEQPLHIHGHVWKAVGPEGADSASEPWRDTAVVASGNSARLAMVANNPGNWAIQSLIAERVDGGLLAGFSVTK